MNSQLDDTVGVAAEVIGVATELQHQGVDPVQAVYIAHMVVRHGIDPFVAQQLPDPRAQHLNSDHTGADHDHTDRPRQSPTHLTD
jgi:hypothetical protein